jgi:hypothetical protein
MATVEECERALGTLADRLAQADPEARRRNAFDRSLSCRLTDLDVVFAGQLRDGLLTDIRRIEDPGTDGAAGAQVKLTMSSDDLVKMVDRELNLAAAWASGRIKVDARVFDLIKLRSVF